MKLVLIIFTIIVIVGGGYFTWDTMNIKNGEYSDSLLSKEMDNSKIDNANKNSKENKYKEEIEEDDSPKITNTVEEHVDNKKEPETVQNEKIEVATTLDPDVQELIDGEVGSISRVSIVKMVEGLLANRDDIKSSVNLLLQSDNSADRQLGMFLYLELYGFDSSINSFALEESSHYIKSDFSYWLFLENKFDDWEKFISITSASITMSEAREMLILYKNGGFFSEAYPSMQTINFGRHFNEYVTEIMNRNSVVLTTAGDILVNGELDTIGGVDGGMSLIKIIERSKADNYEEVLTKIIGNSDGNSAVRWQAVQILSLHEYPNEYFKFLEKYLYENPNDTLAGKIKSVLSSDFKKMDERMQEIIAKAETSDSVSNYVEVIRYSKKFSANKAILHNGAKEYEKIIDSGYYDYDFLYNFAELKYLLWR